jgi:PAS domain S-box-containing protein
MKDDNHPLETSSEGASTPQTYLVSDERLRIAVEAAGLGIWDWNLQTNEVYWNKQHFSLFGMSPRANPLSPEVFYHHIHPEDATWVKERLEQAVAHEDIFEAEFRVVAEDMAVKWIRGYGRVVERENAQAKRVSGIILDITERKETERALRESEERLKLIIESLTDYAIMTLTPEGRINAWSKGAEDIFGYREAEILGERFSIIFTPEDREAGAPDSEMRKALSTGRAVDERYHLCKNGERFYASGVLTLLQNDGEVEGFVKIVRDLSERKAMEDALREADKRKDEFLAVLAHELRTPLAPIRMNLEIMKRSRDRAEREEAREVIERQTKLMIHLIDELLDVARINQGKITLQKERVQLSEIVELALEGSRTLITERGHTLKLSLPEETVYLEADPTRLTQILLNLLTNAAKYTRPGGTIWLRATSQGSNLIVSVKDTGIGIPPSMLPNVFQMFTRLEREKSYQQEGLGIGLSLVKQLAFLHGGTVQAESPGEGQGSTFTLRLPVVAQKREVGKSEGEAVKDGMWRVLVVDDHEPNRTGLARLLRLLGHKVEAVGSGEAALESLTKIIPDVIFLDINMPEMDGYEVARRIRENPLLRGVKLVALTGYGQADDVKRAKEAGFDAHLVKPAEVEGLEAILKF